jgi:SAM-dependent methyltransferase
VTAANRTVDGDADYQFDALIAAEKRHFWFRARREAVVWALDKYLPRTERLLEVGCGTGFVLEEIRRRHANAMLAACDASFDAIRLARRRLRDVHLFRADVGHLPIRGGFDAIAALDVIEHVDRDVDSLREMFDALRPGGGLLVTVPQHRWLWSRVDEFSHHRRRYDRRELLAKTRAAGFHVLRCTSYFMATLPFAFVSRRRASRLEWFDPVAELRMPKILNTAFALALQPEWWLIRAGCSLPAGSSLLLVARRPES